MTGIRVKGRVRKGRVRWGEGKKIGNESAPIQLAQYSFPGMAISNARKLVYFFQIKFWEAVSSNSTRETVLV